MLKITFPDQRNFSPGEKIDGTVHWSDRNAPAHLEIRLIWFTEGKGTKDFELINIQRVECAERPHGDQVFQFTAPHRPFSCSASMLTITWAIELIEFPSHDSVFEAIFIAPHGNEIQLTQSKTTSIGNTWFSQVIK